MLIKENYIDNLKIVCKMVLKTLDIVIIFIAEIKKYLALDVFYI